MSVGGGVLLGEAVPVFSPVGWQTDDVVRALRLLGFLTQRTGRELWRVRDLCRAMTDVLLSELQERRVIG